MTESLSILQNVFVFLAVLDKGVKPVWQMAVLTLTTSSVKM